MTGGWQSGDYLDRPLRDLLDDMAGGDPVPAAGSLIAVVGALAAGLTATVARRSATHLPGADAISSRLEQLRATMEPLITADAADYAAAMVLGNRAERDGALRDASEGLVVVVEALAQVADFATALAATGNPNLRYDAAAAAQLSATAAEVGAQLTVENVGDTALSARAIAAARAARVAAVRAVQTPGSS